MVLIFICLFLGILPCHRSTGSPTIGWGYKLSRLIVLITLLGTCRFVIGVCPVGQLFIYSFSPKVY